MTRVGSLLVIYAYINIYQNFHQLQQCLVVSVPSSSTIDHFSFASCNISCYLFHESLVLQDAPIFIGFDPSVVCRSPRHIYSSLRLPSSDTMSIRCARCSSERARLEECWRLWPAEHLGDGHHQQNPRLRQCHSPIQQRGEQRDRQNQCGHAEPSYIHSGLRQPVPRHTNCSRRI